MVQMWYFSIILGQLASSICFTICWCIIYVNTKMNKLSLAKIGSGWVLVSRFTQFPSFPVPHFTGSPVPQFLVFPVSCIPGFGYWFVFFLFLFLLIFDNNECHLQLVSVGRSVWVHWSGLVSWGQSVRVGRLGSISQGHSV